MEGEPGLLMMGCCPISMRRRMLRKVRRSCRWPDSVEKIQSDSRCFGTTMAATLGVGGEEEEEEGVVGWMGESSTAIRMSGEEREGLGLGLGMVKERKREGCMVSKMEMSNAIFLDVWGFWSGVGLSLVFGLVRQACGS